MVAPFGLQGAVVAFELAVLPGTVRLQADCAGVFGEHRERHTDSTCSSQTAGCTRTLLHAQVIESEVGNDLGFDERYQAAASVYARLGAAVNGTYNLLAHLVRDEHITLNKEAFREPVMTKTTIDVRMEAAYTAPAGSTPMPTRSRRRIGTGSGWTPVYQEFEQIIQARQDREALQARAKKCPRCRGTATGPCYLVHRLKGVQPRRTLERATGIEPA